MRAFVYMSFSELFQTHKFKFCSYIGIIGVSIIICCLLRLTTVECMVLLQFKIGTVHIHQLTVGVETAGMPFTILPHGKQTFL